MKHVETIHLGHLYIKNHQVGVKLFYRLQAFLAGITNCHNNNIRVVKIVNI